MTYLYFHRLEDVRGYISLLEGLVKGKAPEGDLADSASHYTSGILKLWHEHLDRAESYDPESRQFVMERLGKAVEDALFFLGTDNFDETAYRKLTEEKHK